MTERTIEQKAAHHAVMGLEDPIGSVQHATDAVRLIAHGTDCEATRSALHLVQDALDRTSAELKERFETLHAMLGGSGQ